MAFRRRRGTTANYYLREENGLTHAMMTGTQSNVEAQWRSAAIPFEYVLKISVMAILGTMQSTVV